MNLWTPRKDIVTPDLEARLQGPEGPVNRRRFLQYAAATFGGIVLGPQLLKSGSENASRFLDPKARADTLGASAAFGNVFDVYPPTPTLANIRVTYNGTQMVTGSDGTYHVGDTSSVPNLPLPQPTQPSDDSDDGFGCGHSHHSTQPDTKAGRATKLSTTTNYLPNILYFEDLSGNNWNASHDLTGATGTVQVNATLPRFQSTRFGQNLTPAQITNIWMINNSDPSYMQFFTYRTQDLPIPVDGDMDAPADWALVQNSIDRLNNAVGLQMYQIVRGNGLPQPPNKTGIYIYHAAGGDVSTPLVNDNYNPAYLLGGTSLLKNSDFLNQNGCYLDHEIDYHLQNFNSLSYQDGIFLGSIPMTNFNMEHLLLLRLLRVSLETSVNGHSKNDLTAYDYIRPIQ